MTEIEEDEANLELVEKSQLGKAISRQLREVYIPLEVWYLRSAIERVGLLSTANVLPRDIIDNLEHFRRRIKWMNPISIPLPLFLHPSTTFSTSSRKPSTASSVPVQSPPFLLSVENSERCWTRMSQKYGGVEWRLV